MINRLWVVVLIDVASRAVLGYHPSLRRECSADDVLRAIHCALLTLGFGACVGGILSALDTHAMEEGN